MENNEVNHEKKDKVLMNTNDLISTYDLKKVLVIDIGSYNCKIGLSGTNKPSFILPSVIGVPKNQNENDLTATKLPYLYCNKALNNYSEKINNYEINYPLGKEMMDSPQNIEFFDRYFKYIFEKLFEIDMNVFDVFLVDNLNFSNHLKNKLAQKFFEEYKVPSLYFMNSGVLSLFSTGKTNGICIEIGHKNTAIYPVFEGYTNYHASHSMNYGSYNSTQYINEQLNKNGFFFKDKKLEQISNIHYIKEKLSKVSLDYENEILDTNKSINIEENTIELPDGQIIELDLETRLTSGEILINPSVIGGNFTGIVDLVEDSFNRLDSNLKKVFCKNIVLSGGGTLVKGLDKRIKKDINNKFYDTSYYNFFDIEALPERNISAWIGGSMISSITTFQNLFITSKEWEENSDNKEKLINKRLM